MVGSAKAAGASGRRMGAAAPASPGKPLEIEGFFDLRFYTPLGGLIARALARTRATPNAVSWASVAAAAVAALSYARTTLAGALVATVLFLLSGVLDSADGQLARATGRTSELGETLDGFCDTLSFGLVYLAAIWLWVTTLGGPWPVALAVGVAAGLSHSIQSSLVDYERQLFVHIVAGGNRIAREDPAALGAEKARARARGEGWWGQALRGMRIGYCRRQRRWLSSSTALLGAYGRLASDPGRRSMFADAYRRTMPPMLKAWAVLAPNSHTLGVLGAGLAPILLPGWPIARWGLPLVFGYDLLLNVPMLLLIGAQRRIDARLVRDVATPPPHAAETAR